MFVEECSADGFMRLMFDEHPVVDCIAESVNLFDVTTESFPNYSSDFLTDGRFDYCQYCMCLIDISFALPSSQLPSFLEYQCSSLRVPYIWLDQFKMLLKINRNTPFIKPYQEKYNMLILLLEEQKNEQFKIVSKELKKAKSTVSVKSQKVVDDGKFNIAKVREEVEGISSIGDKKRFLHRCRVSYMQEVENNEEASFVKCIDLEFKYLEATADFKLKEKGMAKLIFSGTPTELAKAMNSLKLLRNNNGDFLIDGSLTTFARLACALFCNPDGSPFKESSIRRFLTKYNNRLDP